MANAADLTAYQDVSALNVPIDWVPITVGADPLARQCRAIRANGAGTITVTTATGESRVMNFLAGETRYIIATHITAATGAAATGIEAGI